MKITRSMIGLMALVLFSLIATDVMAQRGGGEGGGRGGRGGPGGGGFGGGRGGGGFGGFGGGRGGGGGGSITGLLRIEEVKTEIELMPDQEEALAKMNENRERPERPTFPGRDASDEDRKIYEEKRAKQAEELATKQREQLEEVLLPEQLERLDEIALQTRGVTALMDPKIAKKLEMTTKQTEELKKVGEETREEMGTKIREIIQGARDGGGGGDSMREAITKLREGVNEKLLGVLTADQKKKFEEMKGEKFEMPERTGRGGPGGDRGGRGGAGGDRGGRGGPGGDRGGRGGAGGDRGGRGGPGGDRGGRGGGGERQRPTAE